MFCPTTNRRFVPMARMSWIKLSRRWLATYTGMKKAEANSIRARAVLRSRVV